MALSTRGRGAQSVPSGVTTCFRPPPFRKVIGDGIVIDLSSPIKVAIRPLPHPPELLPGEPERSAWEHAGESSSPVRAPAYSLDRARPATPAGEGWERHRDARPQSDDPYRARIRRAARGRNTLQPRDPSRRGSSPSTVKKISTRCVVVSVMSYSLDGGKAVHAALRLSLPANSLMRPASPLMRSRMHTPSASTATRSTNSCTMRACSAGKSSSQSGSSCSSASRTSISVNRPPRLVRRARYRR